MFGLGDPENGGFRMKTYTEDQIKAAIRNAGPGLQKYLEIMALFPKVDVSKDRDFQTKFNGFYKIRQRSPEFYQAYYTFLEKHKSQKNVPAFTETLESFVKFGEMVFSFASKLLATLDPNLPVWDQYVLENLEMEAPEQRLAKETRIQLAGKKYAEIIREYDDFSPGEEGRKWIKWFDEQYPDVNITPVKKIDLILWQLRENINGSGGGNIRKEILKTISFSDMYTMLERKGPGRAISSKGTKYSIEAQNGNIVAFPRSGRITIHQDCWGNSLTCQGTRAGGIYNGPYSIYDWYNEAAK
jgi:hypothetical protein